MFQAIMVFSKESSLFGTFKDSNRVLIHATLQTFAILCIITGFLAIYYTKIENGKPHFKSWHGLIGIVTIGYSCIQYVAGFLVSQPRLRELLFMKSMKQIQMNIYHATSGTFLFVLACMSIGLGIYSNWFTSATPFYVWYLSFALASFLGLIISLQVTSKYVKPKQHSLSKAELKALEKQAKKASKKQN